MDNFAGGSATPEDALRRIRAVSALLSAAGGAVLNAGWSQLAAAALHQPLAASGVGLAVLNGLIGAGVLGAGTAALYQANPVFRKTMDEHLEALLSMIRGSSIAQQPQDPPSYLHAGAMELGEASGPVGPNTPQMRSTSGGR